jgi:kynurenine formamidase
MCDRCVIENVKEKMLSRRRFFATAGAVAASAGIGMVPEPAVAQAPAAPAPAVAAASKIHDMTHELHPDFPTYFGAQQFFMEQKFRYSEHKFNLFELRVNEHTGTHIDAPLHFSADGKSVAEIPVEQLIVPLVNIDIREKAAKNPDAQLTPDDIKGWMAKNGPLPKNSCVAMNSGWGAHVNSARYRNADDRKVMHFPGFHVEATRMLIEDGNAVGIASDTLSLDFGPSPDFAVHYNWLASGHWGIECIANLAALPARGATLIVGALKVRGGTGGPCRVFATV